MLIKVMNKYSDKLSSYSSFSVIMLVTISVVLSSVPLVYALVTLFCVEYTKTIFIMSILAPSLMVPPTIYIILKLSKHLKYFKDELEKEVVKNKDKDIILFEQARFILMGEMMANISHQWKQPLNTINLAILSSKTSNMDSNILEKNFTIMEDNVHYLASTIDNFMSFFDKKTHTEIRNLDNIIEEVSSIIQVQMDNKNISLDIEIDRSYGEVSLASSISQVILNLLNNAKDALEKQKDKKVNIKFISKEDSFMIVCKDNGEGIAPEIKDKIFNPYFTTKMKTQGTGIGLYMSKEIIQKVFLGDIAVTSADKETQFSIVLPYSQNCILRKVNK